MNAYVRAMPRLEDEGMRTRKKINECCFNEALESEGRFMEWDGPVNFFFWHKVAVADLLPSPPKYQLVEEDSQSNDADARLPESEIDTRVVATTITLKNGIQLEIAYQAYPNLTSAKKLFKLKIVFTLIFPSPEVASLLRGKRLNLSSRLYLKKNADFNSKRKFVIIIDEDPSYPLEINAEIEYDPEEEIVNEVSGDVGMLEDVDEEDTETPTGMVNLGVTCYMNSYLQTIFHLKKFRYYINQLDNDNNPNNFIFSLQSLFYKLERLKGSSASPRQLVDSFGWNTQQIFTQQDVQEFSFMFLDAIEKKSQNSGLPEVINKYLFQGISESFISCKNIEFESSREEVFSDIQLAIKESRNLHEAIENYLAIEELSGDNAYDTEKFGKQDAVKGVRFKKLPKILIFHLGRFEYDFRSDENMKLMSEFSFPEEIDMSPFIGVKPPSQLRRKSSTISEVIDPGKAHNGASNGNGVHFHEVSQPTSHDSDELYKLIGVFVHFGFNAYSGHYEVYLKIENQWYEFNDEDVRRVDIDEIKRQSFGGKKRVSLFDTKNFRLRERLRDSDGHAYMLVYVRSKDFNEIVNNNHQVVPYPATVVTQTEDELAHIKKMEIRNSHHKVRVFFPETFLGTSIGRGCFFSSTCLYDHLSMKRYKQDGIFATLIVKRSITKNEFVSKVRATLGIPDYEEIYLFEYCSRREEFSNVKDDNIYINFSKEYRQYIYVHREKRPREEGEVIEKVFIVYKRWNEAKENFEVSEIRMVRRTDTMGSLQERLEEKEGQPVSIFYEDLQLKRLDNIEEPRRSRLLFELISHKHQSSMNFVYGVPDCDQTRSKMQKKFFDYKSSIELSLRSKHDQKHFYLILKTTSPFSEVFTFLRHKFGLEDNSEVAFELQVFLKNDTSVIIEEKNGHYQIGSTIKQNEIQFEIKVCSQQLSGGKDISPKLLDNLSYCNFYGIHIPLLQFIDPAEFEKGNPESTILLEMLNKSARLFEMLQEDLQRFKELLVPISLLGVSLYVWRDNWIKEVETKHIYNRHEYFIIPILQIDSTDESESDTVENEEAVPMEGLQEEASLVMVELRVMTNLRRLLHLPILFQAESTLRLKNLSKTLEDFVECMDIKNPENDEQFEVKYLRSNLKFLAIHFGTEREINKFGGATLGDFESAKISVSAVINIDSFRNNIKINI
jgi:ubiquitin C-terminal hydrolase